LKTGVLTQQQLIERSRRALEDLMQRKQLSLPPDSS